MFVGGSVVCAVSGVALHFHQTRLRSDRRFGQLHHLASLLVALASLGYFSVDLRSVWSVPASLGASAALLFVPTHIGPEEVAMTSSPSLSSLSGGDAEGEKPLLLNMEQTV